MKEVLDASLQAVNIIPTILLITTVVYWLIVMLGVIDLDFLDVDVDVDADIDIDGPDVDSGLSINWLNSVLVFFNLGRIPFMLFLSFLALPMWIISVQINYMLGNTNFVMGLAFLIPNLVVSLFIAKFLTMPFIKLFSKMEEDGETTTTMIGKICHVILPLRSDSVGQVEVNVEGSNYRISAKTIEDKVMQKGEEGLIIEYHEDGQYYVVEPYQK